jgi:hypothetical protein
MFFRDQSFERRRIIAAAAFALLVLPCAARAGSVETAEGRRVSGPVTFTAAGTVRVGGEEFRWNQLRVARVNNPLRVSESLPRGWRIEDIGRVQGTSWETNGIFTLGASGVPVAETREQREISRSKRGQAAHFAHRVVRSEATIVARVMGVTGTREAVGGLMLRESIEPGGGHVLLGVSGDGHLHHITRENTWTETKFRDLGNVSLPVWLKLSRADKEDGVVAFRSNDGKNWQQIGQTKLNLKNEPFPDGGEHWALRLYVGLGITSASSNSAATLKADQVGIVARGLLAEYFSDDSFQTPAYVRAEKKIDYWWGDRAPAPVLEANRYSVRWSGQIQPKQSGSYRFHYDPEGTRLWVDGQELGPAAWNESNSRRDPAVKEIVLNAGDRYDLKFEFRKIPGAQAARIGWSSDKVSREVMPGSVMSHRIDARTPDGEGNVTNVFLARGIWLRSGTFLAGETLGADASATRFVCLGDKTLTILNNRIARVVLRSSRKPVRFELANHRTGIFLRSGDFMEAELEEMDSRTLNTSSVLFGRKTFSRESGQALALVFNDIAPQTTPLEVVLLDGSVMRVRTLRASGEVLELDEPVLGKMSVPPAHVQEIRNTAVAGSATQ